MAHVVDISPDLRDGQIAPSAAAVPDLSFVIPAYNEEQNIAETLRRVSTHGTRLVRTAEIIVVDDGSRDGTVATVRAGNWDLPVTVVRLSRNFGKEQAIMAGLRRATGRAVVVLDADLQEPLRYLEDLLAEYRAGYQMVYAVRAHRRDESRVKRVLTRAFYRFLNYGSEVDVPADARDFRLMDRKVVDALCALPENNRFMKGLYSWVGFSSTAVPVELEPRVAGTSKFGLRGLFRLALTGVTSFTVWPLRMWTGIGTTLALISILYGAYLTGRTLILGTDLPGWATLAVAIFFLGGVQLISIGVLGEYLARVFSEVKGRPGYLVAEEIDVTGDT